MRGVRISQVIRLASLRHASLPAELAGCIALAVADQVAGNGVVVEPNCLELFEDGTVRITTSSNQNLEAAEALRKLLSKLLQAACSNTPSLARVAQRDACGPVEGFIRELEVALVPANRGAAKRALARLWREATRALDTVPGFDDTPDPGPGDSKVPSSTKASSEPKAPEAKAESAELPRSELEPPRSDIESAQSIDIPDLELPKPEPWNNGSGAADSCFETCVVPTVVESGAFDPPDAEIAVEIDDCDVEFLCEPIDHLDSRPPGEALTAEPFPLVQLSRRTLQFDDIDVQSDTTLDAPTAVFEDEPTEGLDSSSPNSAVVGDSPPYVIPSEPHRFSAPARFAKKRVSLAEYVSQLGLDVPADDWEIAEHIHRIANSG